MFHFRPGERRDKDARVVLLYLGSLNVNLSVTVIKYSWGREASFTSFHAQRSKQKKDYTSFGHNFIYADFEKLRRQLLSLLAAVGRSFANIGCRKNIINRKSSDRASFREFLTHV